MEFSPPRRDPGPDPGMSPRGGDKDLTNPWLRPGDVVYEGDVHHDDLMRELFTIDAKLRPDQSPEVRKRKKHMERSFVLYYKMLIEKKREMVIADVFKDWMDEYALYANNLADFWRKIQEVFQGTGEENEGFYQDARGDFVYILQKFSNAGQFEGMSETSKSIVREFEKAIAEGGIVGDARHSQLGNDPAAIVALTEILARFNNGEHEERFQRTMTHDILRVIYSFPRDTTVRRVPIEKDYYPLGKSALFGLGILDPNTVAPHLL